MTYIYSRAKHRRSGSPMQKSKRRGDQKRWSETRETLPGYPWDSQFTSHEEILRYLSNDKITCLLCGKLYRQLGIHTIRIHNLGIEDYKFKFNIPQYFSLIGRVTMEIKKEFMASPTGRQLAEKARILGKRPKPYVKPKRLCDLARKSIIKNIQGQ